MGAEGQFVPHENKLGLSALGRRVLSAPEAVPGVSKGSNPQSGGMRSKGPRAAQTRRSLSHMVSSQASAKPVPPQNRGSLTSPCGARPDSSVPTSWASTASFPTASWVTICQETARVSRSAQTPLDTHCRVQLLGEQGSGSEAPLLVRMHCTRAVPLQAELGETITCTYG